MPRPEARHLAAFAAAACLMSVVAYHRWDLVLEAAAVTRAQFLRGGAARAKLLSEIVLFIGILLYTLGMVPERADPPRDAALVALALAAGWLAEAWGTRAGLWTYYTREAPPLWIVPAWPLGALVVERQSTRWAAFFKRLEPGRLRALHAAAAALVLAVCLAFSWPALGRPSAWAALAVVAAALLVRADAARDLPVLAAGAACVAFADSWGTTNNCWRYWLQRPYGAWGLAAGVAFGVCFDTAVVLGCLKVTEGLCGRAKGPRTFGPCGDPAAGSS